MQRLSLGKALQLLVLTVAVLGAGIWGLARIGTRQGAFDGTFEAVLYVADAGEIDPGTPVRIRGIEAGHVAEVGFAEDDGHANQVRLRLKLSAKHRDRLYADAKATIVSKVFGSNFITISPGRPEAGPLAEPRVIPCKAPVDLAEVTQEVTEVAREAKKTLHEAQLGLQEIRDGQGTLTKLMKEDEIYTDLKAITHDTRELIRKANGSVATIEAEAKGVKEMVRTGNAAITAIKQDAEAIKAMPLVRSYVEDPVGKLVRPNANRERRVYPEAELFQPNTAILTDEGRGRLDEAVKWLNDSRYSNTDIVVAGFADVQNADLTPDSARKLTEKQAEVVLTYLKDRGAAKLGWWSRRKAAYHGMGTALSPVVEKEPLPTARVEVLLFYTL